MAAAKERKLFDCAKMEGERKPPFLDPGLNLQELFDKCSSELTAQQSKRDQLIAFYLTLSGLVASYVFAEVKIAWIQAAVCLILAVLGYMWITVILRYRIYKEAYWIACRTVNSLFTVYKTKIDKAVLQHLFYKTMVKCGGSYYRAADTVKRKQVASRVPMATLWRAICKNMGSAEYLLFMTMALLNGCCIALAAILPHYQLSQAWICYHAAGVLGVAFLIWQTVRYNNALCKCYAVLWTGYNDDFNAVFQKAWQLHFFPQETCKKEEEAV